MGKVIIKMYLYHSLQLLDSTYIIIRLNVVKNQFECLGDIYTSKDACEDEVLQMNKESGPVEYEYEI